MKLTYKLTYIDDKTEIISVTDWAYTQDVFWVFPLKNFSKRYIKSSAIQGIEQYFVSK